METKAVVAAFNCPNCGASIAPDNLSCRYCGSSVATRICPACFGSVAVGMRHCPHCGAGTPESASQKPGALKCPRCDIHLEILSVGGHSLNSCSRCGGLWVGKEDFQSICTHEEDQQAVLEFQTEPASNSLVQIHKPQRAYIPCPECGKLMNHKNFSGCSGVVLDWCREHGSWFDRSELQQIVTFIRNGGLRKAREKEMLQLKEQGDRIRMEEFSISSLDRRLGGSHESAEKGEPLLHVFSTLLG